MGRGDPQPGDSRGGVMGAAQQLWHANLWL